MKKKPDLNLRNKGWLLFFYSVPARPTANRLKFWRRLRKAGAVQLKGAVYALPYSDEHYELFQWLVSEVLYVKGDASFVRVDKVETMDDGELEAQFNRQRVEAYRVIEKKLDEVQGKADAIRKSSGTLKDKLISRALVKCSREFEEIRKTDFFSTRVGADLEKRIKAVAADLAELSGAVPAERGVEVMRKSAADYKGRVWVTRKRPFIDRMASAWLIRRFVDEKSVFGFIDEGGQDGLGKGMVSFDMRGGEFTHVGELCTFEVMVKSFGLKDKAVRRLAEIVHELDVKDEKYANPEARGVEDILSGIRKTVKDDADALEKGMAIFEMLYVSKG